MGEVIELRDLAIRELFIAQRKAEEKYGKTIDEVLFEIVFSGNAPVVLEAIKLIYEITMSSSLSMEDIEEDPELAEVIPFGHRESLEEGEE